jgi:hypothetical protein
MFDLVHKKLDAKEQLHVPHSLVEGALSEKVSCSRSVEIKRKK